MAPAGPIWRAHLNAKAPYSSGMAIPQRLQPLGLWIGRCLGREQCATAGVASWRETMTEYEVANVAKVDLNISAPTAQFTSLIRAGLSQG